MHIRTWGIAQNNVYTCGKLGWDARTNLYTPCTMSWYIAAELQYSRNEMHVMMAPPMTVTHAQYVASTEDIAPSYDYIDV